MIHVREVQFYSPTGGLHTPEVPTNVLTQWTFSKCYQNISQNIFHMLSNSSKNEIWACLSPKTQVEQLSIYFIKSSKSRVLGKQETDRTSIYISHPLLWWEKSCPAALGNTHCANTDLRGGSPTPEEEEPFTKKREGGKIP